MVTGHVYRKCFIVLSCIADRNFVVVENAEIIINYSLSIGLNHYLLTTQ
jgi:hypothetical protein